MFIHETKQFWHTDLALPDRICFAARFLPAESLSEYIKTATSDCMEHGKLEGLCLTGLDQEGFQLLQKYLDITGDVQTAALLSVRVGLPKKMEKEVKQTDVWWKSYCEILNNWQLWHQRARLNVTKRSLLKLTSAGSDYKDEVVSGCRIRCKHCGESMPLIKDKDGSRHPGNKVRGLGNKKEILASCHNCAKPLPRCAVCMVPLGYPNHFLQGEERIFDIEKWFVWCQTCGHGGHANHIKQWFQSHNECPVKGCTCKCNFLDT